MPDLATHLLAGFWFNFLFSKKKYFIFSIFLVGCILPDILSRVIPYGIAIIYSSVTDYTWFFSLFHAPVSILFQCIGISYLFQKSIRRYVFLNLLAGVFIHMILDSMQTSLGGRLYFWLFPFTNYSNDLKIFHLNEWHYILAISLSVVIITLIVFNLKKYIAKYIN